MNLMQTIGVLLAALAAPLASIALGGPGEGGRSPEEGAAGGRDDREAAVIAANNAFAFDLLRRFEDRGTNTFFSPASLTTGLGMIYTGAAGRTRREMAAALHLRPDTPGVEQGYHALLRRLEAAGKGKRCILRVADALWAQEGYAFKAEYLERVTRAFAAGLEKVDFVHAAEAARETINRWVADKTGGRIEELLKPGDVDSLARLVLTNAVYFKAAWAKAFDPGKTRPGVFTLETGKTVRVPMMHRKFRMNHLEQPGLQAVELPYAGEEISMVILLPSDPKGLPGLEAKLDADTFADLCRRFRSVEVDCYLPRFEITFQASLVPVLRALGMKSAFTPGEADFSGMTARRDLFLSAVVHQAFASVTEEGTEAAAATGGVMSLTAFQPPKLFRADRPFLFLVRERRKGTILFLGRLLRP